MCYAGHRRFLPDEHFYRMIGQSMVCCPVNYYKADQKEVVTESFLPVINTVNLYVKNMQPNIARNNWMNPCEGDNNRREYLANFLSENDTHFTYYHKNQYFTLNFKPYMYFHHCDYRLQVPCSRISNDVFLTDANAAYELNKNKTHGSKLKNVNGVKGKWAFSSVKYIKFDKKINFESKQKLALLLWFNDIKSVIKSFCKKTHSHPQLWLKNNNNDNNNDNNNNNNNNNNNDDNEDNDDNDNIENNKNYNNNNNKKKQSKSQKKKEKSIHQNGRSKPIWAMKESQYVKLEDMFFNNSVLMPKSVSNELRLRKCFTQLGLRKSKEKINIYSDAMDYICHSIKQYYLIAGETSIPPLYLWSHCQFSKIISDLLSPIILDKDIDDLYYRVVEAVCLHEGM